MSIIGMAEADKKNLQVADDPQSENAVSDYAGEQYPFAKLSENVGSEGKTIEIADCSISFPFGCFDQTQLVTVSASINPETWPRGKVGATPTLNVVAMDLKLPAIVKLYSWCVSDDDSDDLTAEVLCFEKDTNDWNVIHSCQLAHSRTIEFRISHSSYVFAAVRDYAFPSYVIFPTVCFHGDRFAVASVLDNDLANKHFLDTTKKEIHKNMTVHSYCTFHCRNSTSVGYRLFPARQDNDDVTPAEFRHTAKQVVQGKGSFISYSTLGEREEGQLDVMRFQMFKDDAKWQDHAFRYNWPI